MAQPRYHVEATIDVDAGRVLTDTQIELDAPSEPRRSFLHLWLYADRMRHLPPSFDELSAERIFVGGASFGGFGALVVTVEGCPPLRVAASVRETSNAVRGRIVRVPICADAAVPTRVRVRGTLTLARRYGTLGHARDGLNLGDPWYPLVLAEDGLGPADGEHRVHVRLSDARTHGIAGPDGFHAQGYAKLALRASSHVPVFVVDPGFVQRSVIRGVDVELVTQRAPIALGRDSRQDPIGGVHPFEPDAVSRVAGSVREAIETMRSLGFVGHAQPGPRRMAERVTIVEIESRQRLAVSLPGMVAVSDRAFRLFPMERIERFHRVGVWRAAFASLLRPHLLAVESLADRRWVADADAALLSELSLRRVAMRRDRPQDLVGFASFHPAVDQLLYAPQVRFESVYFAPVRERDPDRADAQRALNALPFGRFLYEKLRARLPMGDDTTLWRQHLMDGRRWQLAAERAAGMPLRWFFDQWLGPPRSVAYRIGKVVSEGTADGFEHTVHLERIGDTFLRELVEVEVVDEMGNARRAVWDEAGPEGRVRITTPGQLEDVQLDPDGHVEEDPRLGSDHPKLDNRLGRPWRLPVFNNLNVSLSVLELEPDVFADFVMKPKYDVRNAIQLRLSSDPRGYGAALSYRRGVGDLRDLNATEGSARVGLAGLRSDAGFGGSQEGVSEALVTASLGEDTRIQIYDPATGHALYVGGHLGVDREDTGRSLLAAGVSARGQLLLWPHIEHVVALTAGAQLARCPALVQAMPSLAGRHYLRAYEADELLGCAVAYAIVEERWSPIRGLFVNAANLAWGRRLELVPFLAGGFVSSRGTAADLLSSFHGEAGFGFRAFFDHAGIQPGMMAVDVAYPLTVSSRCGERDEGACVRRRAPFGVHLSFEQTF
jgi:hypothetical protein